jgi:diguanylate cyclase (GGDEF)-like protein
VREALRTGRPVLVEDAATHPLYAGGRAAWGLYGSDTTLRSAVAIPFTVERPQRGVLLLRRTADQAALTADDASLAEQVVEAAVSVLQRARVMEAALADNARLEELATTDPLTRVLNRRALLDRLAGEMERALRYAGTMAVLLLDLDYFKQVNDTYGHLAGDAVLRDLAVVLQSVARSSDVVGRFGGEEFFVVLPETDLVGAHAFAERLRERLAAHPFRPWHDERTLQLTASVGVAAFPGSVVETMDELIGRADAALYRAKAEGRNRVGS